MDKKQMLDWTVGYDEDNDQYYIDIGGRPHSNDLRFDEPGDAYDYLTELEEAYKWDLERQDDCY